MPQHIATHPHPAPAILTPPAIAYRIDRMPFCEECNGTGYVAVREWDGHKHYPCRALRHPDCDGCDEPLPEGGIRVRVERGGLVTVSHGYCNEACQDAFAQEYPDELHPDEVQATASMLAREQCDARGCA